MLYNVFNIFDARDIHVGWATVSVNVTERKRAEGGLRKALEQLQLITDNMPAAVVRYSRDRRYAWVSRGYAALLGRRRQDISGRMVDVIGQDGYEVLRPHVEKVLSGARDEFETAVTFLGTGTRWVHEVYVPTKDEKQNIDGWIALIADVTDRHDADERVRRSEQRFRAIFFQAAVGIAQTSTDGRWLLLNDRFSAIHGGIA